MKKTILSSFFLALALTATAADALTPVDYVSTLVGTESKNSLSTGNTYPAIALPWVMASRTVLTMSSSASMTYHSYRARRSISASSSS